MQSEPPSPDVLEFAPKQGEIFADKYRIERVIGVGGMGYVLAAHHLQLDERVAIKVLLPEGARHPSTVARFLREGRAAVKIRSEHVARVLDVGTANGAPYIVMEHLEGSDLSRVLVEQGRVPSTVAVDWVLQACEAIAEAHAMGTVHRDIKPANLFVLRRADGSDCVKVLDFGISKMASSGADAAMTKTSATIGTPLYMSPEQLKSSRDVDARSDVWSLGVVLFEMISGRTPFVADSLAELGAMVLREDAPDLRTLMPDAPAGLADAIASCLRRSREQRCASVASLAAALTPFGGAGASISSRRIHAVMGASASLPPPSSPAEPPKTSVAPAAARGAPATVSGTADTLADTAVATSQADGVAARPSRTAAIVAVAGLLVVLGVVGVVARRGSFGRTAAAGAAASSPAAATTPLAPATLSSPESANSASPSAAPTVSEAPSARASAEPGARPAAARGAIRGAPAGSRPTQAASASPQPTATPPASAKSESGLAPGRHD